MFSSDFRKYVFPKPEPKYKNNTLNIKKFTIKNENNEKIRDVPYIIYKNDEVEVNTYLIYFHGNAEDLQSASEFITNLLSCLKVHCVAIEYPGYGVYENSDPCEEQILEDSVYLYEEIKKIIDNQKKKVIDQQKLSFNVIKQQDNDNQPEVLQKFEQIPIQQEVIKQNDQTNSNLQQQNNKTIENQGEKQNNENQQPDDIIIFGRSLGSGPAIHLASKKKCKLLITMSAFKSIRQIVRDKVWILSALINEQFNNLDKIKNIGCPAFLIHGKSDSLINYRHSEELFNNINQQYQDKSGVWFSENMTHNDYNFFSDLINPISEYCKCKLKLNIKIGEPEEGDKN